MRRANLATWAVAVLAAVGLASGGCSAQPTPPPEHDGPLVAFYGDSYTRGTGASDPSVRWSTRLTEDRGWREFNPSVNGLGFVNNRDASGVDLPAQIIAADPDIVIVTLGLNDVFTYDARAERIRRSIDEDFANLAAGLPEARFVVVEPFWYAVERPEALEVIIGWVEDAAAAVDADYVSGASYWIQGRPGEMASDGLHPNDAGQALIFEHMDAALAEIGL